MKQFGLPGSSSRRSGGGYYDSRGYGGSGGSDGGLGGALGGGLMDNAGSLMNIAKAFM